MFNFQRSLCYNFKDNSQSEGNYTIVVSDLYGTLLTEFVYLPEEVA
jgi:hypothetical protein